MEILYWVSLAFIFGGFLLMVKLVYWPWWRDARIDEKRLVFWSVQGVTAVATWNNYNQAMRRLWNKLPTSGDFACLDMAINRRLLSPSGPIIYLRTEDFNKYAKVAFRDAYLEQAEFCVPQDQVVPAGIVHGVSFWDIGFWGAVNKFRSEVGLPTFRRMGE